jgi:hypothetical protein
VVVDNAADVAAFSSYKQQPAEAKAAAVAPAQAKQPPPSPAPPTAPHHSIPSNLLAGPAVTAPSPPAMPFWY